MGVLICAFVCAAACTQPAGGRTDIPASRLSTGILYVAFLRTEANENVARMVGIDGGTYAVRVDLGLQHKEEFSPHAVAPADKVDAIWLAADELARASGEANKPRGKPTPGNHLIICVEGSKPAGEYHFDWPLGQDSQEPKVHKLAALLRQVDALDKQTGFSPFPRR